MPEDLPTFRSRATTHFNLPKASRLSIALHAIKTRCGNPRESNFGESLDESESSNGRRLCATTTEEKEATDDDEEEVDMVVLENSFVNGQPGKAPTHSSSGHGNVKETTVKSDVSSIHAVTSGTRNFYNFIAHFFQPSYQDLEEEERYQKELWIEQKPRSIAGAIFLLVIWLLSFALPRPWSIINMVQIYGLGPLFTVPILPFVIFDFPRTRPRLWQTSLLVATWYSPLSSLLDLRVCGFYSATPDCGNRDFQGVLFFSAALTTIGLFSLGARRAYSLSGTAVFFVFAVSAIVPIRHSYLRNTANLCIFIGFVLFISFSFDISSRRVWTLRAQLRLQFRAKQRAQISERKSSESKRRFTAYIFHEVRVPLNTATIACNLLADDFLTKSPASATEFDALKGSLAMMSQVLNDVLDFTRMERGGFSSVSKPMSLHQTIRGISNSLKLDTVAKGLTLETHLDPRIDDVLMQMSHSDRSGGNVVIGEGGFVEEGEGIVLGDEMRLRQVVHNLTSNATKFTPFGGKVSITTKLIYPTPGVSIPSSPTDGNHEDRLSTQQLAQHERRLLPPAAVRNHVVVRLEITDTGVGILKKDLVDQRLFSAYVQTTAGKMQGGKGSGLGLSLVRNIVMLQGGRLGVRSKFGEGSTFWVELSFPVHVEVADSGSTRSTSERGLSASYELLSTGGTTDSDQDFKFTNSKGEAFPDNRIVEFSALPIISSSYRLPSATEPPISINTILYDSAPIINPIPATPGSEIDNPMDIAASTPRTRSNTTPNATLKPSLSVTARTAAVPIDFGPCGPLLILIVDDDALTRKLMSRLLTRLGCICTTAENGKIALELLLEKPFDCTFLDNQMPIIPGTEVVQRMRSMGRTDLIVGVTANALRDDQDAYLNFGASFVLTKPVVEMDLRKMLAIAVERRALALEPVESLVTV